MVLDELPPLETDGEKNQHILCGFETPKAMGWHPGTVHSRKLSVTDLKNTPSANFVIKFKKSVTKDKNVDGCIASELTERTHGPRVWRILLQKRGAAAEAAHEEA